MPLELAQKEGQGMTLKIFLMICLTLDGTQTWKLKVNLFVIMNRMVHLLKKIASTFFLAKYMYLILV